MGYIASGETLQVVAYLTQTGRELLLKGNKENFKVKYFALGDSDINYFVEDRLTTGFITDLSGESSSCIKAVATNVDIKNKVNKD